jgi:enoyl-CoA hydratase/carnithine racemase
MTNSDLVGRTDHDGVAVVMLNAPESINALSEAMLEALSDVCRSETPSSLVRQRFGIRV